WERGGHMGVGSDRLGRLDVEQLHIAVVALLALHRAAAGSQETRVGHVHVEHTTRADGVWSRRRRVLVLLVVAGTHLVGRTRLRRPDDLRQVGALRYVLRARVGVHVLFG